MGCIPHKAGVKEFKKTFPLGKSELMIISLLVIGASFAIIYSNVQTYDPVLTPRSGYPDTVDYIAIYKGDAGSGVRAYRPLVPWLARLMPDLPKGFFTEKRELDEYSRIAVKFGMVNFLFLIGSCLGLYILHRLLGLSVLFSAVGLALFTTSTTVVRSAGLPMTDVAFFFFFILAVIALARDNVWLLLFSMTIGALAKELILLVVPLMFFATNSNKSRIRYLLTAVPSILIYFLLHSAMPTSTPGGAITSGISLGNIPVSLKEFIRINAWINLFLSFGIAWPLWLYGLFCDGLPGILRRWSILVPIVFMGVLAGLGNLQRSMFSAAPVFIPVASFGAARLARAIDCSKNVSEKV